MDCKEVQVAMIDYLDRGVDARLAAGIRAHMAGCEQCKREIEEMRELLLAMADQEMRQPGSGLRENFQMMLQSEVNVETADDLLRRGEDGERPGAGKGIGEKVTAKENVEKVTAKGIGWMVAAALILLAGGFWIGTMVAGRKAVGVGEAEQLSSMQKEIKEMKQVLLYSLIDDESASQRIKAVSYADEISHPDEKVFDVLIHTLNHDKNVNVRLAALYSLSSFSDNRVVRDSLVSSLPAQTEPVIQVMLINLLTEKKDARAVAPIRAILTNKKTLPVVKDAAQKSLKTL